MLNWSRIIRLSVSDKSDTASPKPIFFSANNQSSLLYVRLKYKLFHFGNFRIYANVIYIKSEIYVAQMETNNDITD